MQASPIKQPESTSKERKPYLAPLITGFIMLGCSVLTWVLPYALDPGGVGGDTGGNWLAAVTVPFIGIPLFIGGMILLFVAQRRAKETK